MKKKSEVYVTVDSPKVAKKLKKVLDMFGEPLFDIDSIDRALKNGWSLHFYEGDWCNSTYCFQKTKVTVSELKQILFREHAKEGDVVVCGIEGSSCRYIVQFNRFAINGWIEGKWIVNNELTDYTGYFDYFIRYATEEEKALLNPVKELEVGKWYWVEYGLRPNSPALVIYNNGDITYGFAHDGEWTNNYGSQSYWSNGTYKTKEATPQEVEAALIKEAKRRYKVGDKLSKVYDDYSKGGRIFSNDLDFAESNSSLWIENDITEGFSYSSCIFHEGQWAEVMESEKPKFEVTIDTEQVVKTLNKATAKLLIIEIEQKLEQLKKLV